MIILAIESSCDETAVAIIENGTLVKSNVIASQIHIHQKYGGVVPELASRMHAEKINLLIEEALKEAAMNFSNLDAVAVTHGPGLEGALLVGLIAAKTISQIQNIPLIPINHLHGHIYANFLLESPPSFPFITLIVSGGHTQLVLVKDHFQFERLGTTRDDAAGEAFDKIARALDLGYPGGPIIEKMANQGDPAKFAFPRAMSRQGLDFSFSGLKTAVIQQIRAIQATDQSLGVADLCASFQQAVIDVLILKSLRACDENNIEMLVLSGGVAANKTLRQAFDTATKDHSIRLIVPPLSYCTDNAAMIGAAAFFQYQLDSISKPDIAVQPSLSICN